MEKIKDYAIIGNGRSSALISGEGSLDLLCWPRYDSPSHFAKILDQDIGGSWKIAPTSFQKIENTNILQTRFYTETGVMILTDFMAVFEDENSLQPYHEIIRRLECEKGEVEFSVNYDPRSSLGKNQGIVTLKKTDSKGKVKAGEKIDFSLTFNDEHPAVIPPLGDLVTQKKDAAIKLWKKWTDKITYQGPYRKEVIRSALTSPQLENDLKKGVKSIILDVSSEVQEKFHSNEKGNLKETIDSLWKKIRAYTESNEKPCYLFYDEAYRLTKKQAKLWIDMDNEFGTDMLIL